MAVCCVLIALFSSNLITVTFGIQHIKKTLCDPKNPHEECRSTLQTTNASDRYCEPNEYIFIDCNVCRCGINGKVDERQCTKYKCKNNKTKARRLHDVGKCEPKHWYQFSECHLCYCVDQDTLVCNSNNTREKVLLGQYDLFDCGNQLIHFLLKLVPSEERLLLRSVTKKIHGKTRNKDPNPQKTAKSIDTSTPFVMLLSRDKSLDFSKSKEDKTDVNNKFQNTYHEEGSLADTSGLLIDSLEDKVTDLTNDTKHVKHLINSVYDAISNAFKDVNRLNNDDLPNDLDKILGAAIRKSMVTISSGTNCRPGSTVKHRCSTCFCLTNGKTLCTKKICD